MFDGGGNVLIYCMVFMYERVSHCNSLNLVRNGKVFMLSRSCLSNQNSIVCGFLTRHCEHKEMPSRLLLKK